MRNKRVVVAVGTDDLYSVEIEQTPNGVPVTVWLELHDGLDGMALGVGEIDALIQKLQIARASLMSSTGMVPMLGGKSRGK